MRNKKGQFIKGGGAWNKKIHIEKECEVCGKKYKVKQYRGESTRTCSNKCQVKLPRKRTYNKHSEQTKRKISIRTKETTPRGDKCHSWKGGITPINEKIRKSVEYKLWRDNIFKRDNYICQNCKNIGGNLHAHHIVNFSKDKYLRFSINNGITLCKKCHNNFHKKYGIKNNTKQQIAEFINWKTDLRKDFWNLILEMARKDKDIILLVGDLGYSFFEKFKEELPNQFINAGIAEQNMIGVAAGLALGGKKPFVYSGAVFAICRPYEFIRDEVCYNKLDVKIIGTGAADFLGFSHNFTGLENEWDLLKNLPNLKVGFPKNETALAKLLRQPGAAYIRI
jgi:5-methylcytosine-specific restriction endonuclease McrA